MKDIADVLPGPNLIRPRARVKNRIPTEEESLVYFIQDLDGGPIKIGHSNDVSARIKRLETHYGKPLALLAEIPGNRNKEHSIHEQFSHLRLGRTEQFRPAPDLLAFIGRPLLVGANPDTVEVMPELGGSGRITVLTIKGSPEWAKWLRNSADRLRSPIATLVDQALAEYMKNHGITEEPPKR